VSPRTASVYVIGATGHDAVKIGWAADPRRRLRDLQIGCPLELTLLWAFPTADVTAVEAALHRKFNANWLRGEWFDLGPDGALIAQQAYAQITGQPELEPELEPPFESVMAEPARLFLADIRPWVTAQPSWAKWVTAEHLARQLEATGLPRWQQVEPVKVGRMLDHLFDGAFKTPTRNYSVGFIRVAKVRRAARELGNDRRAAD
jgi:Meiotically up-regulated gene 113